MEEKVLILGYKSYNFTNKDTGEVISGTKVSFVSSNVSNSDNEKGLLPIQISVNEELAKGLMSAPAVYKVKYGMLPGKGNKPNISIIGFEFVNNYEFEF